MDEVEQLHPQTPDNVFNDVRRRWRDEWRILSRESKAEDKVKIINDTIAVEKEVHRKYYLGLGVFQNVQTTIAHETASHKRRIEDLNKELAEASSALQDISEEFDDAQRMAELAPQPTADVENSEPYNEQMNR